MDELKAELRPVLERMKADGRFPGGVTAHEVIRELGRTRQRVYAGAISEQADRDDPFREVHKQISQAVGRLDLVREPRNQESETIFGEPGTCKAWSWA